jgi:hypothetical protein
MRCLNAMCTTGWDIKVFCSTPSVSINVNQNTMPPPLPYYTPLQLYPPDIFCIFT